MLVLALISSKGMSEYSLFPPPMNTSLTALRRCAPSVKLAWSTLAVHTHAFSPQFDICHCDSSVSKACARVLTLIFEAPVPARSEAP